jgi:EF-hand domain pair
MNKIATLAAILLIGTVVGGPAAFAQAAGQQNSGAGVQPPGMMGMGGHGGMMGMGGHGYGEGRGMVAPRIIFSLMDANGDGKLTLEEWQAAQERIFKAMDTDHDGTVTFEEMQVFMHGH